MRNVYIAIFDGAEHSAFSNRKKAVEFAKKRLKEVKDTCPDYKSNIIEYANGVTLEIFKPDDIVVFEVNIIKLNVK